METIRTSLDFQSILSAARALYAASGHDRILLVEFQRKEDGSGGLSLGQKVLEFFGPSMQFLGSVRSTLADGTKIVHYYQLFGRGNANFSDYIELSRNAGATIANRRNPPSVQSLQPPDLIWQFWVFSVLRSEAGLTPCDTPEISDELKAGGVLTVYRFENPYGPTVRALEIAISVAEQHSNAPQILKKEPEVQVGTTNSKRFRVAFSFAGGKRDFVGKTARILANLFGEKSILYDKYHEAEFARSDLGIYLPDLYHKQADLVVVVACKEYEDREWCGLEWTAIHALLKNRRVEEVLLSRFDRATIKGLYDTAGWIDLDTKSPDQAAQLILKRLALNDGMAKGAYPETLAATKVDAVTQPWRNPDLNDFKNIYIPTNQFDNVEPHRHLPKESREAFWAATQCVLQRSAMFTEASEWLDQRYSEFDVLLRCKRQYRANFSRMLLEMRRTDRDPCDTYRRRLELQNGCPRKDIAAATVRVALMRGWRIEGNEVATVNDQNKSDLVNEENVEVVWRWLDRRYHDDFIRIKAERRERQIEWHDRPGIRSWRLGQAILDAQNTGLPAGALENRYALRAVLLGCLVSYQHQLPTLLTCEFATWQWETQGFPLGELWGSPTPYVPGREFMLFGTSLDDGPPRFVGEVGLNLFTDLVSRATNLLRGSGH